jgi:hypothetical protein
MNLDTFLGTAADEQGKPRVTQNGNLFRWSQSSGRYVYFGPAQQAQQPTNSPARY